MRLERCRRRKGQKDYIYWELVESHRTERGPRRRVVAYLGNLEEGVRLGVKEAASGQVGVRQGQLLTDDPEPEWVEVDVKRVRVERGRQFRGYWLGPEVWKELGLASFLEGVMPAGREEIPRSERSRLCVFS